METKSKSTPILAGDRNIKYFLACATGRMRRSYIKQIKDIENNL